MREPELQGGRPVAADGGPASPSFLPLASSLQALGREGGEPMEVCSVQVTGDDMASSTNEASSIKAEAESIAQHRKRLLASTAKQQETSERLRQSKQQAAEAEVGHFSSLLGLSYESSE